jgi:hypothetical protein
MALGGARPGAGRPKGVPNKANQDLRKAAQEYTQDALNTLRDVMLHGDSAAARVQAASQILDRAHGKASQHVEVDADIKQDVVVTAISLVGKKDT